MSEPMISCPKCEALLRLPKTPSGVSGRAELIRCPRCKTVLEVETTDPTPLPEAPAAPARAGKPSIPVATRLPSPPPAAPAKPAIPLPFGRSTTAAEPLDPIPVEVVDETPATQKSRQGKLIKDEDPAEIREREIREEAAEKARQEADREERRFERLKAQCKPAQQGVTVLGWACGLYSGALLLCFLFATAYVIGLSVLLSPLLYLAAFLGAANWALSVVGLAMCVSGPKSVRPMATSALIFAAAHAVLFVVQLAGSLAKFANVAQDVDMNTLQTLLTFQVLGSVSNLNVLSEFPGDLIVSRTPEWLGTAGGVLELTRLIMIGMLCQYYASEGKDAELGYQSLKFITRVFVIVLSVTLVKIIVKWLFVDAVSLDGSWTKFGAAAASMASAGLFLSLAILLYTQTRVLLETAEIIDARRFTMKSIHEYRP